MFRQPRSRTRGRSVVRCVVVLCAVLLLASCAPVQDRSYHRSAIRSEILAEHVPDSPAETPGAAVEGSALTDAEFNRQRLTIEPVGMSAGFWSGGLYGGSATGMSWRKWLAYQGFSLISEPEFFRVAGYEEEAGRAERHHTGAIMEAVGGGLLATMGLVILADSDGDVPLLGILTAVAGIGLAWDGSIRMDQNWAPFDIAKDVADQYNSQLLRGRADE